MKASESKNQKNSRKTKKTKETKKTNPLEETLGHNISPKTLVFLVSLVFFGFFEFFVSFLSPVAMKASESKNQKNSRKTKKTKETKKTNPLEETLGHNISPKTLVFLVSLFFFGFSSSRFSSSYFWLCGDPKHQSFVEVRSSMFKVKCFLYNIPAQKVEIGSLQKAFFPIGVWFFVKRHISVVHLFSSEKASRIVWISSNSWYLKHDVKMFGITFLS